MNSFIAEDAAAPSNLGTKISEARPERNHTLTIAEWRQARKSKRLDEPLLKTAHRSEGRKSVLSPFAPPITETEPLAPISESPVGMDFPVPEDKTTPPPQLPSLSAEEHKDSIQRISHTQGSTFPITPHQSRPPSNRRTTSQNVFQAREAIEEREKNNLLRRTRKDARLSAHFGNRDIKFLVDNAETMKQFWYEATYLLEVLVMKAVGQDEDGMDLYFTNGTVKVLGKMSKFLRRQSQAEYVKAMHEKLAKPTDEVRTDMKASLAKLLTTYIREAEHSLSTRSEPRKLTIIVLTDGKWEGMAGRDDVKDLVIKFVGNLKKVIGDLESRPVSIEFIQFGDDAEAAYRLRQLDTGLKWYGIEDIIDTEPSVGDVNKMLLGSFVWFYDNDDGEEEEGEAESSVQRIDSTQYRQTTGQPTRSSTLMSADQVPRTIPQVLETDPSTGHSLQSTLETPPSSSPQPQRYSPVHQPYKI